MGGWHPDDMGHPGPLSDHLSEEFPARYHSPVQWVEGGVIWSEFESHYKATVEFEDPLSGWVVKLWTQDDTPSDDDGEPTTLDDHGGWSFGSLPSALEFVFQLAWLDKS